MFLSCLSSVVKVVLCLAFYLLAPVRIPYCRPYTLHFAIGIFDDYLLDKDKTRLKRQEKLYELRRTENAVVL
jgi:hypothetical protein